MRTIIAGSRHLPEEAAFYLIKFAVDRSKFKITHVIEGGAVGVDEAAREFAVHYGLHHTRIEADWEKFGKSAGPRRNSRMEQIAEQLIAIKFNESRGTQDMITKMKVRGKPVYTLHITEEKP